MFTLVRSFGRLLIPLGAIFAVGLIALPAGATEPQFVEQPFDAAAFQAAQEAGEPILVEVHASWCGTCRKQGEILQQLSDRKPLSDMTVFKVDYDEQKDVVEQMKVTKQATLIVFKGDTEVGRSIFDTNAESIQALLEKAG